MKSKLKKIIIGIVVIIIIFVVYTIFFKADPESNSLLTSTQKTDGSSILGQEILKAINQIKSLDLETSVFDDPVLNSLRDQSEEIIPERTGRPNPFAPLTGSPNESVEVRVQAN